MAFMDSALNMQKLKLSSDPWNDTDFSYKNRAELSCYVDDTGAGFTIFLNHPDEVDKKVKTKDGQDKALSIIPVQARLDPIRFKLICNVIKKLVEDDNYKGMSLNVKGIWYSHDGDIIVPDGTVGKPHIATIQICRNDIGEITMAIREEQHPQRESRRPGARFRFTSGMWFDIVDNDTGDKVSPAEDSKLNAMAFVEMWEKMMTIALYHNYNNNKDEREKKRQEWKNRNKKGNSGQSQKTETAVTPAAW